MSRLMSSALLISLSLYAQQSYAESTILITESSLSVATISSGLLCNDPDDTKALVASYQCSKIGVETHHGAGIIFYETCCVLCIRSDGSLHQDCITMSIDRSMDNPTGVDY